MSGGGNIAYSGTRAEALTIQSSTAGMCIPWLRGMHRVPCNLLWYGDFQAISTQEKAGGKGGSPSVEKISYRASLVMGLCHGQAAAVPRVWKGKAVTTLSALGVTLLPGAIGQAVWSPLVGRGAVSIGYSGLVALGAYKYALGESASVENHSVEVRHSSAYSAVAGIPDVDPAVFTADLLTDASIGAGLSADLLDNWSQWSNYCVANDLLMSPLLTTQVSASEALQMVADLTNTAIVPSAGKLRMVPYGDTAITANGRTYTPDLTPAYELTADSLLAMGMPPIKMRRRSPADRFNEVPVQYKNRAADYAVDVVRASDLTDINARGRRTMDTIQADWICRGSVARQVAELKKQRSLLVVREFEIQLPWHFALVEGMDLLLLTDTRLGLDRTPVRITNVVEDSDETLVVTCEDFPSGVANAPRYPVQANEGFAHNANADPGNALAPVIFELPGALASTGLELAIATGGADANWGGCQVWVSYDGTSYRQLTELRGASAFGTVQARDAGTYDLAINSGRQLLSGSATAAANLETLLYIAPASGVADEYLAYETATLIGANSYRVANLVRGAYATGNLDHAASAQWVRVDDTVARSGPLDPALIGKTIYVKLLSFNVFGAAVQSLADVGATAYTITGAHFISPSSTLSIKRNYVSFVDVNYNECYIHGRDASGVAADVPGVIMVNGQPRKVPNGPLYGNNGPFSGFIVWDMGGTVFTVQAIPGYPYAAARRYGGQWQYDPNNGQQWVNFTPTDQTVVIGTVESGGPDSGAPGAPPGITAATMWAHASTLDALVANAAIPSVQVVAGNLSAQEAGFNGHSVSFSTGFSSSLYARGHVLTVYNPVTDTIESGPTQYDTWASGTAGLVAALAGIPAGRIITLYTCDAGTHDAALRAALVNFGGSAASALWVESRVSHAFIGQRGMLPGQAYAATSSASDASGVVSLQAYYTSTTLVRNGSSGTDGTPGAPGANGQTSYLHIKYSNDGGSTFTASAGETPGAYIGTRTDFTLADSSNPADYTWALIKGADGVNGTPGAAGADGQTSYLHIKWSNDGGSTFTASSGETPGAYIGTRTDFTFADSSNPADYTWALVKGADGTNGIAGAPGADGTPSYLHIKWSDDGGATFTASSGETPGRYIGTYTDSNAADSTSVGSYVWALVKGADGANGTDAVGMTLSAASVTLQANSSGVVSDYSLATTTAKVMRGAADDSANWAFTRTNGSGVTSSISGSTLSVTAMTGDTGYVDVTATRAGFANLTARFTLAKAKVGAPPAAPTVSISGGDLTVTKPNGGASYGSRTASASGGQSPYSYEWTIVYQAKDNSNPGSVSIGGSGATVNVNGSGTDNIITGQIQCEVTDYYGSKGTASFYVNATHGSPL